MKLGIIGDWSEEGFRYVNSKGLEWVEFCVNHDKNSADFLALVPSMKQWSEKYNVKVGSIGRWGSMRIKEDGTVDKDILQDDFNLIDAASQLGCPVFNCGCNYIDSLSFYDNCMKAVEYFSLLLDYAKGKNVKIATYNCDWGNFVYNDKAWTVTHGALPELGIKYDVSHCMNRHGNPEKELRDWGDRVVHFHLKGTHHIDGSHYDDPPAGLDSTNWGPIFNLLCTKGYKGMVSIEPHSNKWRGEMGEWGIDFTINYIKPYIMPDFD